MSFKDDIQGSSTSLFPVVDLDGSWYSTNPVVVDGNYCKPILMNIPSIKESVDIESRKFKISRVSLEFNNFPLEGERFSDQLSETSLINKEAIIYFKSQTDKYEVYRGIVRRISHTDEKVRVELEDLTEKQAHKDFPEEFLSGFTVPEKYQNKPIPMVYGHVDKSPLVINQIDDSSEITLNADSKDIEGFIEENDETLYIGNSDGYARIKKNSDKLPEIGYLNVTQYIVSLNDITIPQISGNDSVSNNPLAVDIAEVEFIATPNKTKLFKEADGYGYPSQEFSFLADNFSDTVRIDQGKESDGFMYLNWYKIGYSLKGLPISNGNFEVHSELNWDVEFNYNANNTDIGLPYLMLMKAVIIDKIGLWDRGTITTYVSNLVDDNDYDLLTPISGTGGFELGSFTGNGNKQFARTKALDLGWNESIHPAYSIAIYQDFFFSQFTDGTGINADCSLIVNDFYNKATYPVDKISQKNFYANTKGRINTFTDHPDAPQDFIKNPIDIIYDLVRNELGYNAIDESDYIEAKNEHKYPDYNSNMIDWEFAFTVNKKINSKKLIEEIAKSTKCFPRFKNDGTFGFNTIKRMYTVQDYNDARPIKALDVISYSFKKTKPEQIYNKVDVQYYKDYAQNSLVKRTPAEEQPFENYGLFYGIEDSYLEFESDYIRDDATAEQLAKFLYEQNKNDHLIFNLKLPLNYIDLDIGELVKFEELLDGVKAFGIDYRVVQRINLNSHFYPLFMVTSITKNLDSISIECMQLHMLETDWSVFLDGSWSDISFPDSEPLIIEATPFVPDVITETYEGTDHMVETDTCFIAKDSHNNYWLYNSDMERFDFREYNGINDMGYDGEDDTTPIFVQGDLIQIKSFTHSAIVEIDYINPDIGGSGTAVLKQGCRIKEALQLPASSPANFHGVGDPISSFEVVLDNLLQFPEGYEPPHLEITKVTPVEAETESSAFGNKGKDFKEMKDIKLW